jgi:hypothetical protein
MLRKISLSVIAGLLLSSAYAQDSTVVSEKTGPTISGSVDAYYRFNFSNLKSDATSGPGLSDFSPYNNYTSFTNSQNSFELGMASLKLEHTMGKVGVVADLGFGKRAEEFSYNDANTMLAIKQAYVTYAPKDNIKFTAGSWATHVGYELVDAYLNRNYSMSYMFSYGPFFHTGVKADITAGKSGFMIGVANPTDLKSANFQQKFGIAQYSYGGDAIKLYLNYVGGNWGSMQKQKQIDAVVTGAISDKFSIGFNGTLQSNKFKGNDGKYDDDALTWWGSALYLNVDPTSNFGLTLRGEYIDNGDTYLALPSSVFETTLSLNFKAGGLTIIPELRLDSGKEAAFIKNDGTTTKSTVTGLLAAVYKF